MLKYAACPKAANSIIGKTMDFDLNGDGFVNFPGDRYPELP